MAIPTFPSAGSGGIPSFPPVVSAFVPSSIPGLVLDLNANLGIALTSGAVSTWADQSGAGNDYTQATSIRRPVVTASVFGSLPAVTNTSSTWLQRATSPLSAGSDRTIFAVCKGGPTAGGAGGALIMFKSTAGSQYIQYLWDLSGTKFVYSTGALADTIAGVTIAGTKHICSYTGHVGSIPTSRVDGIPQTVSGGNNVVNDNGTDISYVGNILSGAQGFVGDIGRMLVYNNILTAGQIGQVEQYLSAVYGIAVS